MTPLASAGVEPVLLEEQTLLDIVLNRPKGNVLTSEMLRELEAALVANRDNRHLRLVVIRGAGGTFSFGASIEEHRRETVAGMLETFHRVLRTIASYPIPIAALVEGRCLGGAFELALCCHFVFATPAARFACPEIRLGVIPPVLAAIGARRLPPAMAERLLLTGEELEPEGAVLAGFVTRILDTGDPHAALLDWYRAHLAPISALALREGTSAIRRSSGLLDALQHQLTEVERQYLDRVVHSHDGNEGIDAFLARRTPQWEDR